MYNMVVIGTSIEKADLPGKREGMGSLMDGGGSAPRSAGRVPTTSERS